MGEVVKVVKGLRGDRPKPLMVIIIVAGGAVTGKKRCSLGWIFADRTQLCR